MAIGKFAGAKPSEIRTPYDMLEALEHSPGIFLGKAHLTALWHWWHGYRDAMLAYGLTFESENPPFRGFHDFVAKHYGWRESTAGWCNIILQENGGDELKGFNEFYVLLKQFRQTATR